MDNFFIDFETFWGVKYSLRTPGMSYTDFIAHEKYQTHGASCAFNTDEPHFFQRPDLLFLMEALKERQQAGKKVRVICHNVLFDGMILFLKYGFVADEYFCTLAMVDAEYQGGVSRGLDECMKTLLGWETGKIDIMKELKDVRSEDITPAQWEMLATYANDDLRATQQLYATYSPLLPELEHKIMDIILQMFVNPALVFNEEVLDEAIEEADADRESRIAPAIELIGGVKEDAVNELRGNATFPKLLERLDIVVPMKPSPTVEGKMIPALAKTDPAFQQMLESKDTTTRVLAIGRLAVKSTQATTRAYRFKKMNEEMKLFAVAYNYARAHTWRVSGANKINPANLKRGSKLRTCIEAPRGFVLGVADASQIECRGNGFIAGQTDLMELFADKRDPYNDMASTIFARPVDRKGVPDDFFAGFLGKTATLGLGFQMGGPKFKLTVERDAKVNLNMDVDFDLNEAYRIVDLYRRKNFKIKEMWGHCQDMLYAMVANKEYIWEYADGQLVVDGPNNKIYFPNGTWLYYPGLSLDNGNFTYLNKQGSRWITKYIYGGLLCENIVQHFARNITSWHMVSIAERYRVVMHTYDENIALIPKAEAEEGVNWMVELMSKPPRWAASLPLAAEGGYAREYSK